MATICAKSSHIGVDGGALLNWLGVRKTEGNLTAGKQGDASGLDSQETRSGNQSALAPVLRLSCWGAV